LLIYRAIEEYKMDSVNRTIGMNDLLRLSLELWALVTYGYWGLNQSLGILNYMLMVAVPIVVAIIWGTFAVPNDPSRSGGALVPVPGVIRLFLEFLVFGFAFWIMYTMGLGPLSIIFGFLVILHYVLAHKRIRWLLGSKLG